MIPLWIGAREHRVTIRRELWIYEFAVVSKAWDGLAHGTAAWRSLRRRVEDGHELGAGDPAIVVTVEVVVSLCEVGHLNADLPRDVCELLEAELVVAITVRLVEKLLQLRGLVRGLGWLRLHYHWLGLLDDLHRR